MSTAAPPDPAAPAEVAPPVVAVVVTRNPGPFLEAALAALGAQDYPALSVLVVDAGSAHDLTSRVAAALPSAFVRRLGGDPGFGGAANEAIEAVQGATFFLVCHDDVVMDPTAVQVMVEEAYRSNAAVVGPKLVAVDDPSVILEVGRAIDRLGGSHTGIEKGEVDQEQHDAVRDVFYVSSAAMLMRADLFDELRGFDPETFPGAEDLDLCWRARLAGARVMVAPDARATHAEASAQRGASDTPSPRSLARNRVRAVMTCYSTKTLLWVIPVGIAVSFVEATALALTRRRTEAFANLGAWWWNLLHFGRLRPARRAAQALRRVPDGELRELQVSPGASVGSFLAQHRTESRIESLSDRGRDRLEAISESLRHPALVVFLGFLAILFLGSRSLVSHGVPDVGTFAPWTGVRSLLAELSSAWRHTGMGSTSSPPPALAMMAALGTVLFGAVGFAQTLVVVGALVAGPVGAFRLGRTIAGSHGAAAVTALAYGVAAVPRNAVANGRLGPLVLYALAPFLAVLVVRVGRFAGTSGTARRPLLGLAIVTAIATAWYPLAVLAPLAIAVAFVAASPAAKGCTESTRAVGAALVGGAGAALLLAPWTATLLGSGGDRGALGLAFSPRLDLVDVLRFQTGPNGAGFAAWGLLVAALGALVIADGPRLAWAIRGWVLAILGYAAVFLPARLVPDAAVPAPEAALALAALGIAIAAGIGTAAVAELLAAKRFDWRQVVGGLAMVGVVLGTFGFMGDAFDGSWRASDGWRNALAFAQDRQFEGQFRVLWLGDPAILPLDPTRIDGSVSYTLTRNGPGDVREYLRAPEKDADRVVARAVQVARSGETSRLGRMLAPASVRYVAVALRNGPGGSAGHTPADLARSLDSQLDLARVPSSPSALVLYENESWIPTRAVVSGKRASEVPTGSSDPLRAAVGLDLSGSRSLGDRPAPAGTVLLGEAFDSGWSASTGGRTLRHGDAFGFTNSWTLPSRGAVDIGHDGQGRVVLLLLLEVIVWIAALVWWSRGRRQAARTRVREPREVRLRDRPRDFIDDMASLGDDVDFWDPV
jgi:GT2 family glycosyltransferase